MALYMAVSEEFFITGQSDKYPTHNGSHPEYNTFIVEQINNLLLQKGYTESNFSSLFTKQIDDFLIEIEDIGIDIIEDWITSRLN